MTEQIPGAAHADYDRWLNYERDRDGWDPDDPMRTRETFLAGWRRGVSYLALLIVDKWDSMPIPSELREAIERGESTQAPPSG